MSAGAYVDEITLRCPSKDIGLACSLLAISMLDSVWLVRKDGRAEGLCTIFVITSQYARFHYAVLQCANCLARVEYLGDS